MISITARTADETDSLVQAALEAQAQCLKAHRATAARAEEEAKAQEALGDLWNEIEAMLTPPESGAGQKEDQEAKRTEETNEVDDSVEVGDWDEERKLRLVRSYSLMPSSAFRIDVKVWSSDEVPQVEAKMGPMVEMSLPEDSPTTSSSPSPSELLLASLERAQASTHLAPNSSPAERLLAALVKAEAAAPTCAPPPSQLILESLSRAQDEAHVKKVQVYLSSLLEEIKQRCEKMEKLMSKDNEDKERILQLKLNTTIRFAFPHLVFY